MRKYAGISGCVPYLRQCNIDHKIIQENCSRTEFHQYDSKFPQTCEEHDVCDTINIIQDRGYHN